MRKKGLLKLCLLFFFFLLPFVVFAVEGELSISLVNPTTAVRDFAATFEARADGPYAVASCRLLVGGKDQGGMAYDERDHTYQTGHVFTKTGTYKVAVQCEDVRGVKTTGPVRHVVVTDPADREAPVVGVVKEERAQAGEKVEFSVELSDNRGVTVCELSVGDVVSPMQISRNRKRATAEFTFNKSGAYRVWAKCRDEAWNETQGGSRIFPVFPKEKNIKAGALIKMPCGAKQEAGDPCTAVYIFGKDGKRHAFPTERMYFSWYEDFRMVVLLDADLMAAIPLGRNVTYHPGKRLVKFPSSNAAYAVNRKGVLQPVFNGDVARAMYGEKWTDFVDVVPEAFYSNYTIGEVLRDAKEFKPERISRAARKLEEELEDAQEAAEK